MVVLVRGTKSSRLSRERRGQKDEAEAGHQMVSQRYLGAIPSWALRTIRSILYSMRLRLEVNGDVPSCKRRFGSNCKYKDLCSIVSSMPLLGCFALSMYQSLSQSITLHHIGFCITFLIC